MWVGHVLLDRYWCILTSPCNFHFPIYLYELWPLPLLTIVNMLVQVLLILNKLFLIIMDHNKDWLFIPLIFEAQLIIMTHGWNILGLQGRTALLTLLYFISSRLVWRLQLLGCFKQSIISQIFIRTLMLPILLVNWMSSSWVILSIDSLTDILPYDHIVLVPLHRIIGLFLLHFLILAQKDPFVVHMV